MARLAAVALAFVTLLVLRPALAQNTDSTCRGLGSNDAHEECLTQEMDKEMAAMVANAQMPAQLSADERAQALALLVDAQKRWLEFRDVHCRWEVSVSVVSARTKRGQLANCLVNLTFHRHKDLQSALELTRMLAR